MKQKHRPTVKILVINKSHSDIITSLIYSDDDSDDGNPMVACYAEDLETEGDIQTTFEQQYSVEAEFEDFRFELCLYNMDGFCNV